MTDIGMSEDDAVASIEQHFSFQTPQSDSLRDLINQVERDVIGWRPQPGDVVAGVVKDITDSNEGDFGSYVIIVVETEDKQLVGVHCFHTTLRRDIERRLQRGTLRTGDEIAIMYRGEGQSSNASRSAPNLYRVAVRRKEQGGANS
jgi:hypothetical protein